MDLLPSPITPTGMASFDTVLEKFERNPAASTQAIQEAAEAFGVELPKDYIAFLRECNGGEGMIGENYVVLWNAAQLAEMNNSYQVAKSTPGLLLFGSDGGGEAFAFDTRTTPWRVVIVPFVGMALKYAKEIADSFESFIRISGGYFS